MGEDDNQTLTVHAKEGNTKKEEHYHKKHIKLKNKDSSQFRCFTCDEKGNFERDCPKGKDYVNKGNTKRYHTHVVEDDEPVKKRAREGSSSDEEYVL